MEIKEEKEKEKFDYIISLGGNCSVGLQLKKRRLRTCSFPLDWLYLENKENAIKMINEFRNDFSNSFAVENLVTIDDNMNKYNHYDKVSGYNFIHTFMHKDTDIKNLKKDEEKIKKRIKRLYSTCDKKVAFIFSVRFDLEDKYINELYKIINSKWKNAKLYVILFNTPEDSEKDDGNLFVWRLKRQTDSYDFWETNYIWHFLDNFQVEEYKKLLFGQILYKRIYKGIKIRLLPKITALFCLQLFIFGLRLILSIGKEKNVFREV